MTDTTDFPALPAIADHTDPAQIDAYNAAVDAYGEHVDRYNEEIRAYNARHGLPTGHPEDEQQAAEPSDAARRLERSRRAATVGEAIIALIPGAAGVIRP